mgnify:CR=1 FL=1
MYLKHHLGSPDANDAAQLIGACSSQFELEISVNLVENMNSTINMVKFRFLFIAPEDNFETDRSET